MNNESGRISKLAIVGGGSAGWMTAAYLSRTQPWLDITLVESSDIPIIGVGEATIAYLANFLRRLGLKDKDWMPFCNGAYKYAIRFDNWHQQGEQYWHPFEAFPYYRSQTSLAAYWWYQQILKGGPIDRDSLYTDCFLCTDVLKQNKLPRPLGSGDFQHDFMLGSGQDAFRHRVGYAYHFDAGLFGEFLKTHVAKPAGVKHIIDDVTEIHQDERGYISHLDIKSGAKIEADLFVDCSGFRSLIIEQTLKEPYQTFSDTLFCDKAIAMQIPYENRTEELRPYTTATALSTGWVWNTPLTSRRGTGYVYCSGFKSKDEAEEEYRNHLGVDRVKDLTTRHIDIRVGKFARTWVKNCVAIGLSSSFVEPLESTGIHFIHQAADKLSSAIDGGSFRSGDVVAYNWYINEMIGQVKEFLGVHYGLTAREDSPFWKEVKYNTNLDIGNLPEILAKARYRMLSNENGLTFGNNSWIAILNGMNYLPVKDPQLAIPPAELKIQMDFIAEMKTLKSQLLNTAPNHAEFLNQMATQD